MAERIAIIGSGVSGLICSWLLTKDDVKPQLTIYEKNDYLGGHTNTVDFTDAKVQFISIAITTKGRKISVDTGFIVYNNLNYPNLKRFFEETGVKTQDSDMSFSYADGTNDNLSLLNIIKEIWNGLEKVLVLFSHNQKTLFLLHFY